VSCVQRFGTYALVVNSSTAREPSIADGQLAMRSSTELRPKSPSQLVKLRESTEIIRLVDDREATRSRLFITKPRISHEGREHL